MVNLNTITSPKVTIPVGLVTIGAGIAATAKTKAIAAAILLTAGSVSSVGIVLLVLGGLVLGYGIYRIISNLNSNNASNEKTLELQTMTPIIVSIPPTSSSPQGMMQRAKNNAESIKHAAKMGYIFAYGFTHHDPDARTVAQYLQKHFPNKTKSQIIDELRFNPELYDQNAFSYLDNRY